MKKIIFIFLFLSTLIAYSQLRYTDELPEKYLDLSKNTVKEILEVSDFYLIRDLNKSLELIKLAEKKNSEDNLSTYINLAYANYYLEVGFFDISLEKALISYHQLIKINDKEALRKVRRVLAKLDRFNLNIDKSIKEYNLLISETSKNKPSLELGGYYLDIANTCMYLKNDKLYEKTKKYLDLALTVFEKLNNKTGKAMAYSIGARRFKLLLFNKGDKTNFNKTEASIKKAITIFKELDQVNNEAYALYTYGTLFSIYGDHKSAIPYYKSALKKYKKIGELYFSMKISQHLFVSYSILNENKLAIDINQKYIKLKDSIFNIKKRKFIADSEVKFQVEKIKSEKKIAELNNNRTRSILIGSIIIFILFILLLLFYFEKLKTKRKIEFVKLELKETQKRLEVEKLYNDSELKVLKSQMNPHFIFNALNSIQDYIILNEKKLARQYLIKFSKLIRIYLEQSQKSVISLSEEIKALTLYLELEKDRFNDDFTFNVSIDDTLDLDNVSIPSLFLQPYVENALKHGLLHKKDNKRLSISFQKETSFNLLICTIKDNGIGREASLEINKKRNRFHNSFATSANQKRIDLLNQINANFLNLEINDLFENEIASGTEVVVKISLNYKK
ncbi:histidine kinase [uncultured Polaribacter sp.]|uniref:tetratricopeptide repeat-containing sensor histidine kinase n=1 Tax=uncultured Polaribacter sp. TaxID=174711 RepID=UPI00260FA009|nr:histidine kinase [uncultured Polaribacter sp.]